MEYLLKNLTSKEILILFFISVLQVYKRMVLTNKR